MADHVDHRNSPNTLQTSGPLGRGNSVVTRGIQAPPSPIPLHAVTGMQLTPFEQAFAREREAQGPGGKFDFEGSSFTTDRADDITDGASIIPQPGILPPQTTSVAPTSAENFLGPSLINRTVPRDDRGQGDNSDLLNAIMEYSRITLRSGEDRNERAKALSTKPSLEGF